MSETIEVQKKDHPIAVWIVKAIIITVVGLVILQAFPTTFTVILKEVPDRVTINHTINSIPTLDINHHPRSY